jgi:hypothetical protein
LIHLRRGATTPPSRNKGKTGKQNSSEIRNNEKEPGKIPVPAIL